MLAPYVCSSPYVKILAPYVQHVSIPALVNKEVHVYIAQQLELYVCVFQEGIK